MDKKQAQQQIRDIFQNVFQRGHYEQFIRHLLNQIEVRDAHYSGNLIPAGFTEHITQYWRIGKYIDPEGAQLDLLIVEVKSFAKLDRARTALRNFAVNRLKQFEKDFSLVAFYAKDDNGADWRFSFVKIEHTAYPDDKGKVRIKSELTPAKRYSYLVGVHENSHTAQIQLLDLLTMDYANPTIGQIEAAFSIEKVTNEFFTQYKDLYLKLSEQIKGQPLFKKGTAEENAQMVARFAKKLLGQIVFLYFLQKKGWLGVSQAGKWGTGPRRFMAEQFQRIIANGGNYYNDFLQYLFYEALARERRHQPDPDFYARFGCKIPFLNGGLFEADYDWQKITLNLPNELFRNEENNKAGDTGTGILDVFERYNFTIKEDEPLEKEVAVDPEMLGKVFENMLEITERKSKGAFYTPREIVHYMCQESLIHYLDNALNSYSTTYQELGSNQTSLLGNTVGKGQAKLTEEHQDIKVPKTDIEYFIRNGHLFAENDEAALQALNRVERGAQKSTKHKIELPKTVQENARLMDAKLAHIRVCDPAIGSGAFPVGLLHEIVSARLALAPHTANKLSSYELKRHTIRESLYGVDIDASAIDIARLRLWLSLIVDEDDYSTIEALPNLDYKIVRGNSLIGFPENWNSPASEKIEKLKNIFFNETDQEKKAALKERIDAEIQARMTNSKKVFGYSVDFDFRFLFSEVWHEKGGFDVVIGNPPYVRADRSAEHTALRKAILNSKQYETLWEKWDLYVPFIEKGYRLLRAGGITTMIVSDAYCHSKYAQKSQKWFLENSRILRLDFFSKIQLFDAGVRNITYFFQKADGALNSPERRVHDPVFNRVTYLTTAAQQNLDYRAFFPEDNMPDMKMANAIYLSEACYISYGLRPSSEEQEADNGFITIDLLSETKDEIHSRPYVDGKHLSRWLPEKNVWIEWGTERAPNQFYRPTFEEMYAVSEKILAQRSPGPDSKACYDDKQLIYTPSSVGFIPWHLLSGVRNRSIIKSARYSDETTSTSGVARREVLEGISRNFSLKYLLAVMNSSVAKDILRRHRRSNIHLYPDDWKKLAIPNISPLLQRPLHTLVDYVLFAIQQEGIKLQVSYLEQLIDALVFELYFPEELKAAGKAIFQHLGKLKTITDDMSDEKKLAVIQSEFDRLYDPQHPVRNHLETLDSVEVVRTIREALK